MTMLTPLTWLQARPAVPHAGLMIMMALAVLCAFVISTSIALASDETGEWPESATQEDLLAARTAFIEWGTAYQNRDYGTQWRLTDKRIRRWFGQKRWTKSMLTAEKRTGELESFEILGQLAVKAEQLPCTEYRHCYRRRVCYVFFKIASRYSIAAPPQPEYAVMAFSNEGWRFGGGTFPNRPLGETAVIMTEADEKRYVYDKATIEN
ncbi:MAG: hypothetical protein R3C58_01740 [Parvularculaceae bacterium]